MELPLEIWNMVFSSLPVSSLRAVSLTCAAFNLLARRFIFSSLTITVELTLQEIWEASVSTSEPEALIKIYTRLHFYTSQVAPDVQSCTLKSYPREATQYSKLRDMFSRQIPSFHNLRHLTLLGTIISSNFLQGIAQLPPLSTLTYNDCRLQIDFTPISKIVTRDLIVNSCVGQKRWLSTIDSRYLCSLHLLSPTSTLDLLEEVTGFEIGSLPALSSLYICGHEAVICSNVLPLATPALASVVNLYVLPPLSRPTSTFPAITPITLVTYDGPHYWLRFLLREQRNLQRVRLFGNRWEGTCDMVDIHDDFALLHRYATCLETLQLQTFPTAAICAAISSQFPMLKQLCFFLPLDRPVVGDAMLSLTQEAVVFAAMNMSLGAHVEHLVVYMFHYNTEDGIHIIDSLTSKYPALRRIHLHFLRNYSMRWIYTPPPQGQTPDPRQSGMDRGLISSGTISLCENWF